MTFEPWQWALLVVAAMFFGFSKTGIPGISLVAVGIVANLIPAKQATGVVLPLLIFADVFAYAIYRKHLDWHRVGRLLPWALCGIVVGWLALGRIDNQQTARLVGVILVVMLAVHFWRRRTTVAEVPMHGAWFGPAMGLFAGFTTMIANAAGPVMSLYLLAMRLNRLEFVGTAAAFFLVVNWIKVPFVMQLGLIDATSLSLNLRLLPAVALGALLGRPLVERVHQRLFENLALGLAMLAAVKLLF